MQADELRQRTKKFSIDIIHFIKSLPKSDEGKIISNQLIRSATSVGANYRAVCVARSNAEFYAKLCIVVEEADETIYWLEILNEITRSNSELDRLLKESNELTSIFSKSRATVRRKYK